MSRVFVRFLRGTSSLLNDLKAARVPVHEREPRLDFQIVGCDTRERTGNDHGGSFTAKKGRDFRRGNDSPR